MVDQRVKLVTNGRGEGYIAGLRFNCPGCNGKHVVRTNWAPPGRQVAPENQNVPTWGFNGDMERPTLTPSVDIAYNNGDRCHSFVQDGKIQFLGDCTHALAGQTVDLPLIPLE